MPHQHPLAHSRLRRFVGALTTLLPVLTAACQSVRAGKPSSADPAFDSAARIEVEVVGDHAYRIDGLRIGADQLLPTYAAAAEVLRAKGVWSRSETRVTAAEPDRARFDELLPVVDAYITEWDWGHRLDRTAKSAARLTVLSHEWRFLVCDGCYAAEHDREFPPFDLRGDESTAELEQRVRLARGGLAVISAQPEVPIAFFARLLGALNDAEIGYAVSKLPPARGTPIHVGNVEDLAELEPEEFGEIETLDDADPEHGLHFR